MHTKLNYMEIKHTHIYIASLECVIKMHIEYMFFPYSLLEVVRYSGFFHSRRPIYLGSIANLVHVENICHLRCS